MAASKPVKVLLAGDVSGALPALLKRVEAVNNKNGPFDLLICVGGFFAPGGERLDRWRACAAAWRPLLLRRAVLPRHPHPAPRRRRIGQQHPQRAPRCLPRPATPKVTPMRSPQQSCCHIFRGRSSRRCRRTSSGPMVGSGPSPQRLRGGV
jgi:hypothetical protein